MCTCVVHACLIRLRVTALQPLHCKSPDLWGWGWGWSTSSNPCADICPIFFSTLKCFGVCSAVCMLVAACMWQRELMVADDDVFAKGI
mmetsp:Transcript_20289/g.34996  ORF Transcript_20289/g.34996 Transcript_20289/m.34996 type:complete len:88 (+) Transcript_20289:999-1262(+)